MRKGIVKWGILVFTFFILLVLSKRGVAQELKYGYYPDGKIRYKGYFVEGKPQGELIRYYPEGTVQARLNHQGDTVKAVLYSRNGEYTSTGYYVRQTKNGSWKYAKGNQVLSIEEYRNDLLNGKSVRYGEDGQVLEQKIWKGGQLDGTWSLYYRNGKLRLQAFYLSGKLNGLMNAYSWNGQLKAKGIYKDNLKEGEWIYYDEDGQVLKKQVYHAGIPEHAEQVELEESRKLDALILSGKKIPDPAVFADDPEAYMKLMDSE